MKFLVMVQDSVDNLFTEIESDTAFDAADKFVNDPENDVEDDDVILVAEKLHKFEVSKRVTVKEHYEPPPKPQRKGKGVPNMLKG